ncbi:hypothetical protein GCM10009347_18830 [Shewanella algicola]|nr:hypothetical protein GCM10009347_18830 [Shewanella algicola]
MFVNYPNNRLFISEEYQIISVEITLFGLKKRKMTKKKLKVVLKCDASRKLVSLKFYTC